MALIRVRYKGLSDVREMSQKDLAEAGVSLDSGLRFDHTNKSSGILIEDPSDRLLEIFRDEGTFQVSHKDVEAGEDEVVILQGAPLDDTGVVVTDATAGRQSGPDGDKEVDPKEEAKKAVDSGPTTTTATGSTGKGRST
jgi:hypothetical protein